MEKIIVLDIGSGFCKIGFGGEPHPRHIYPSIVGKPKKERKNTFIGYAENCDQIEDVGENCKAAIQNISYPIIKGKINDWEGVKALIEHGFDLLIGKKDIQNHPIVITDSIYGERESRLKIAELMFNEYHASHFYVDYQPFFSLTSKLGYSTGLVVEIGDGVTQIFPCIGTMPLKTGMMKYPIGGSMITRFLLKILNIEELNANHLHDLSIIKERYCRVSLDYLEEKSKIKQKQFEYKNHLFQIGVQQIEGPEILFNPPMDTMYEEGIHHIINNSILSCKESIQDYLYENIILSGGVVATKGFKERLEKELCSLAPNRKIKITALPNPNESAWRGASRYSKYPKYFLENFAISRKEYEQYGSDIIENRCFSLGNNDK